MGLVACRGGETPPTASAAAEEDAVVAFLESHWAARPIAPQGPAPAEWDSLATDLSPSACAACHPAQYEDWRPTLHSGAYSPGLTGQLDAWRETDPATVESCMACHAPLFEQQRRVLADDGTWVDNAAFDPGLESHGVTCAACHVRAWERFGPPRRDGTVHPAPDGTPHEGATRATAFEDSRFCAPCHQFEAPAPAGKPLENTVREWEASEWAERGVSCQGCHMPDRRHLWRGIHDPETTRGGVTPSLEVSGSPGEPGFGVRLVVANTGTGHHFPTYVTPAVDLEIAFLAGDDTLGVRRRTLQRVVAWDGSEWTEIRDDRIASGEAAELVWSRPAPAGADRIAASIRVRPDAFYTNLFEGLLADGEAGDPGREAIRTAYERTLESPYELWREERPLPDP